MDRSYTVEKWAGCQTITIWIFSIARHEYPLAHGFADQGDHKPVSAYFDVCLEAIILERFQAIHAVVLRELDKLENDARPMVSVSSEQLQFDTISFLEPVTRSLKLENTGVVFLLLVSTFLIQGNCILWVSWTHTTRWLEPKGVHIHSSHERQSRS